MFTCSALLLLPLAGSLELQTGVAPDADSDGLTDFLETHKYLTDPSNADSDGDGIPDGDWLERREYAYTVRTIIQVMKPVTPTFLNDAYQDARVLDDTDRYVELEVIHYPLVNLKGVGGDGASEDVTRWLAPGPTSNASPALGASIREAMREEGEVVPKVESSGGVTQIARWLLKRAPHRAGFTVHITGVDARGRFFIPEALAADAEKRSERAGASAEDTWPFEFEAEGMFQNRRRGSCSSSAIYLSGCLRALGVPTRTVLCVPVIDACDDREWELLRRGVKHPMVRKRIETALEQARGAYASHTLNEVYVNGRWHRLNYADFDAGTLNKGYFGLMTHVATFHDWADARMWETVGVRNASGNGEAKKLDVFGFNNPYSTIALRDRVGVHCKDPQLPRGAPPTELGTVVIEAVHWTDSGTLPPDIVESNRARGRVGLIAEMGRLPSATLREHLRLAASEVLLTSAEAPSVTGAFQSTNIWGRGERMYVYIQLEKQAWRSLVAGAAYRVTSKGDTGALSWTVDQQIAR